MYFYYALIKIRKVARVVDRVGLETDITRKGYPGSESDFQKQVNNNKSL